MKMVEAIIQPDKLPAVKQHLRDSGITKMTVFRVKGCGQQMGYTESYRGRTYEVNLLPKVCIRIAVNDEFVQKTVDAIIEAARSGTIGDGKIFVTPLEQCIRIRTGETGAEAIG
ncbi:MAG: P-II family nitrogen regulator [Deltaproteobacteria bacterium]|nr:P-II family nitrogen regulator [Deltaproteobacteria bacterium]